MTDVPESSIPRPPVRALVAPFWTSRAARPAWLIALLIAALVLGTAPIYVYSNDLAGQVVDGLVAREWQALGRALVLSVAVGVLSGILVYIQTALTSVLELQWRTALTDGLLERWFASHAFADIERDGLLSNADQRIAEDAKLFVERSINLVISLVSMTVGTITYTVLLWQLSLTLRFSVAGHEVAIPGYMVYVAVAYCGLSLAITHWVGKQMIGLSMHRQNVEADFRFRAMQVRENAEQIAFYRGSEEELKSLRGRFGAIRRNFKAIIVRQFKIGVTTTTYGKFLDPLPTVAALPLYFTGQISMGGITRLTGAYGSLVSNLSFFAQAYVGFTDWLAVANRLRDLLWAIDKARGRPCGFDLFDAQGQVLSVTGVVLHAPGGELLTRVPDLRIAPGERVLVRGPSGTGKSTLLRAIAGLWPHGAGEIRLPGGRAMFLPQRSYIPTAPLKDALCYPAEGTAFSDEACRRALADCGLDARLPSLTELDQWQQVLSGGEQQRLALARVLLHRPAFIFLDEATSALDPDTEQRVYERLGAQLPESAIVSIAHRDALDRFHDRVVTLVPA